jgi:hypothetical protein
MSLQYPAVRNIQDISNRNQALYEIDTTIVAGRRARLAQDHGLETVGDMDSNNSVPGVPISLDSTTLHRKSISAAEETRTILYYLASSISTPPMARTGNITTLNTIKPTKAGYYSPSSERFITYM